jgi:MoxR-vWA-beta-propeller ternary system domain bpX4
MSALADFLEHLFATGEARLTGLPELDDPPEAQSVLHRAFAEYRLDVAGPPIDFDPEAATAAALFTARACWFAVSRDEPPEQLAAAMNPITEPKSAAAHLSIDLTLRYAVTVHRRIRAQAPEDALPMRLADVLRRCPLTGALSDLTDPPTGDTSLAGHPGLELLYAERLASHFRPAWLPASGRIREVIEWVYQHQGTTLPVA